MVLCPTPVASYSNRALRNEEQATAPPPAHHPTPTAPPPSFDPPLQPTNPVPSTLSPVTITLTSAPYSPVLCTSPPGNDLYDCATRHPSLTRLTCFLGRGGPLKLRTHVRDGNQRSLPWLSLELPRERRESPSLQMALCDCLSCHWSSSMWPCVI